MRSLDRRGFLKTAGLVSGVAAALTLEERVLADKQSHKPQAPPPKGAAMPMGKIGHLKVSRLICGGNLIGGFMDGTFIAVEREVDAMTKVVGADGEVSRTRSANRSGQMTITLKQDADSNTVLGGYAQDDELDGSGLVDVLLTDNLDNKLFAANGWIRKPPNIEYGSEFSGREWVLDLDKIDYEWPAL